MRENLGELPLADEEKGGATARVANVFVAADSRITLAKYWFGF